MSDNEKNNSLKDDFELREKRLKLIYKILYVLAAIWGAMIIAITTAEKGVLPIFSGIISVVTTAIINILYYIFGELRCMKIYQPATDDEKDSADNKFVDIWNTFVVTVVTTFAMALANTAFPEYINTTVIMIAMFISSFALTSLVYLKDKKHNKAKNLIRNIAVPVLCYAFFAILQLPEAGTNV